MILHDNVKYENIVDKFAAKKEGTCILNNGFFIYRGLRDV